MKRLRMSMVIAGLVTLSGCGGGGGGSPGASTPPVVTIDPNLAVPLRAAIGAGLTNGRTSTFTVSGWTGAAQTPVTGSGTITQGAATAVAFNGGTALRTTQILSGSLTVGGNSTPLSSAITSFAATDTYATLAEDIGTSYNSYAPNALPATVKVGDTGLAWQGKAYTNSSVVEPGTQRIVANYLVEKDSATSLLYTVIVDTYGDTCDRIGTTGQPCVRRHREPGYVYTLPVSKVTAIYRVTAAGAMSPVSAQTITYTDTGAAGRNITLTFQ